MDANQAVQIIDYTDDLKDHVKNLNLAWIEKYFHPEPKDIECLSNPKEEIIDKGGFIFCAKKGDQIIGTISLLKGSAEFEVGKMAVSDQFQGQGIGKLLLEHCFSVAKAKSAKKLVLYSNTMLKPALHLYYKLGFVEVPLENSLYERANIKMEKIL